MSQEDPSVTRFRDYLRIKSVHPKPDYESVMVFLEALAKEYQLEFKRIEMVPGKPIALLTWKGTDPTLPTVLLNSHTDVVPAEPTKWNTDPFAAHKDEKGNIYARGTQDMKCVGVQYIEAIGRLKKSGFQPLRTIYLSYVPDEEIGGLDGMAAWVETAEFQQMNVGITLDEGLASPDESMIVFYGERAIWWVRVKSTGATGHGSRFIENTAMEKLIRMINRLLKFRNEQFDILQRGVSQCGMKLGDVTTVNLTALRGGVTSDGGKTYSLNVIPTEAEAGFDIRIPPTVNLQEFKKQLDEWTSEEGMSYEFVNPTLENKATSISHDNKWWQIFHGSCKKLNLNIDPQIFPAATDSRFIRQKNIPAFGFSPINNTPTLLHDHNEFLNEKVFLDGIGHYTTIITDLANAPKMD